MIFIERTGSPLALAGGGVRGVVRRLTLAVCCNEPLGPLSLPLELSGGGESTNKSLARAA